jgi:Ca2+-binding EF-hand superfamily protein
MMLDVAPTKGDVATMVESMDLNKDGSVDFYEFCVHMQHLRDQRSASDVEYALDQAFSLFKVDEENNINEEELARLFCMTSAGCALSPDEFAEMVEELGFKQGEGKLSLSTLRQHPCFDTVF